MKRTPSSIAFQLMLALVVPTLHGQQIQLKLVDARNGKPITSECVNVWIGTERDRHLVAETGNDGIAVLKLGKGGERYVKDRWPGVLRLCVFGCDCRIVAPLPFVG